MMSAKSQHKAKQSKATGPGPARPGPARPTPAKPSPAKPSPGLPRRRPQPGAGREDVEKGPDGERKGHRFRLVHAVILYLEVGEFYPSRLLFLRGRVPPDRGINSRPGDPYRELSLSEFDVTRAPWTSALRVHTFHKPHTPLCTSRAPLTFMCRAPFHEQATNNCVTPRVHCLCEVLFVCLFVCFGVQGLVTLRAYLRQCSSHSDFNVMVCMLHLASIRVSSCERLRCSHLAE